MKRIKTFEIFGFGKKAGVPISPIGTLIVWRVPIEMEKLKIAIELINTNIRPFDLYFVYSSGIKPKTKKEYIYIIKEENAEDSWDDSLDRIKKNAIKENKTVQYMGDVDISPEAIKKYNMEKDSKKYNI